MPKPRPMTQRQFAKAAKLSPGRIGQLAAEGLPTLPDGRIDPDAAKQWIKDNLDPKRREAAKPEADALPGDESKLGLMARLRGQKLIREARILDIELKRREGSSIDKAEVEAAIFERARFERDSWHGWTSTAATTLSSELGCDPQSTFALLDRLVREQLRQLSESKFTISATPSVHDQSEHD